VLRQKTEELKLEKLRQEEHRLSQIKQEQSLHHKAISDSEVYVTLPITKQYSNENKN
jgi:hypothetical protein